MMKILLGARRRAQGARELIFQISNLKFFVFPSALSLAPCASYFITNA
jgi:hypothetical protein